MKLFLGLCLLFFAHEEAITSSSHYKITIFFSICQISIQKSQKKEDYPWGQSSFTIFHTYITINRYYEAQHISAR